MIKNLHVQNFRKHEDFAVNFDPGMVIITGANGSGKTSLIEAIHIVLQGKSWRSSFSEILRDNEEKLTEWWRVDLEFSDGEKRTVKFMNGVKAFDINGKTFTRLPSKFKKPTILFEPNDLQLLYGSPSRRRDFFDRFIIQIEPLHATHLRKFERILSQRNNLLKQGALPGELFVWDLQFADLAEKIITTRDKWIKEIAAGLTKKYQEIATTKDQITIKYVAQHKSRQQILNQLKQDSEDNWPYTKTGPQTHDIKFKINNHDAKLTASRGESRTIIFAVLATMTKILNQALGEKIYLLFDDIDSELDTVRQGELYKTTVFGENYLFATTIKTISRVTNNINLD
jgi:DNA replication and repair protein RecF